MRVRPIKLTTILSILLSLPASGRAEPITFTRVANTATPIPSGSGNFVRFDSPNMQNGVVVFTASGASGSRQQGIYSAAVGGPVTRVADSSTPIPGMTGTFQGFGRPEIDNGTVVSRGTGFAFGQQGIYAAVGSTVTRVIDTATPVPGGGPTTFDSGNIDFSPSFQNGVVAFRGGNGSLSGPYAGARAGVYATTLGGAVVRLADRTTTVPNSAGTFTNFGSSVALDDGVVVFNGYRSPDQLSQPGLYSVSVGGGPNARVIDDSTPIPGGVGAFTNFGFGGHAFDGGLVAFVGSGSNGQVGIFTSTLGGIVTTVADTNTLMPGGGTFTSLGGIMSIDDGNVAFFGGNLTNGGLYIRYNGELLRIFGSGDLLDGKAVSSLTYGREGLSGNQIAFRAQFTDGSEGIYVATFRSAAAVPEPTMITLLAVGTLSFPAWVLARRKKVLLS